MKASLKKTLRVTTTKYEYEIVEAGIEYDSLIDGDMDDLGELCHYLNGEVDAILRPELLRLYDVTDEEQASFVIPYVQPYLEGAESNAD